MWMIDLWGRLVEVYTGHVIEVVKPVGEDATYGIRWVNEDGTITRPLAITKTQEENTKLFQQIVAQIELRNALLMDISGLGGGV